MPIKSVILKNEHPAYDICYFTNSQLFFFCLVLYGWKMTHCSAAGQWHNQQGVRGNKMGGPPEVKGQVPGLTDGLVQSALWGMRRGWRMKLVWCTDTLEYGWPSTRLLFHFQFHLVLGRIALINLHREKKQYRRRDFASIRCSRVRIG